MSGDWRYSAWRPLESLIRPGAIWIFWWSSCRFEPGQYADTYFGLLHALEELFARKIDLVDGSAVRNRYLLHAINQQRQVVYAA